MEFNRILVKQKLYEYGKDTLHEVTIESYNDAFEVEFTHNSTAIEGNTLTLMETKVVLEDGISIGGKALRDIPLEELPEDTSLQRNLKPYLRNNGKIELASGKLISNPFCEV